MDVAQILEYFKSSLTANAAADNAEPAFCWKVRVPTYYTSSVENMAEIMTDFASKWSWFKASSSDTL